MVYSTVNNSTAGTSCQYEWGRNCVSQVINILALEYSIQSEQSVAITMIVHQPMLLQFTH